MLDEQKVVYETIKQLSEKSHEDGKKRVIIVKGGPGTGKTVVAVNLLAALTNEGEQMVQYATSNSAPRSVYKVKLKGTKRVSSIDNMFKNTGAYVGADMNIVDTVLVDEAHRLREKSGVFHNLGENQIEGNHSCGEMLRVLYR